MITDILPNRQEYSILYRHILVNALRNPLDIIGEKTVTGLCSFMIGAEECLQSLFQLSTSFIHIIQELFSAKYGIESTGGIEEILKKVAGTDDVFDCLCKELELLDLEQIIIESVYEAPMNPERQLFKEVHNLKRVEADFYFSLMRIGVMPGNFIGKNSFQRVIHWIRGYNFAMVSVGKAPMCLADKLKQIIDDEDTVDSSDMGASTSKEQEDQQKFDLFFITLRADLKENHSDEFTYISKFLSAPSWSNRELLR